MIAQARRISVALLAVALGGCTPYAAQPSTPTASSVDTTFVMHDAHTATVTFRQGVRSWVKQLEKTRDDPTVVCW